MQHELTTQTDADALIITTFKDKGTPAFDEHVGSMPDGFKGGPSETKLLCKERMIVLAGLGDYDGRTPGRYARAVGAAVNKAKCEGMKSVAVLVDDSCLAEEQAVARAAEAAILTGRVFDRYKTKKEDLKRLDKASIVVKEDSDALKAAYEHAAIVAEAANEMRDLQDTTAEELHPAAFAEQSRAMAEEAGLECDVWDEQRLAKEGYNAIVTVGKGSSRKPRLVTLQYKNPEAEKTICLVGKGITFDSGGYNIKPTGYMEDMQYDMSGAALVHAAMKAVARLRPKVNVVGILGLADNMISGEAYRPSDVITTAAGVTVEVANTDAEGRLVLADALYHATTYKPDAIVDYATLTGSCIIALGTSTAAIMGNDETLAESLIEEGRAVGEQLWPLPLFEEYDEDIKSEFADIKNLGFKREAGTITAGSFLKQFVNDVPWAHVDIAGVAWVDRPRHFTKHGGTGWGVRTTVEWLRNLS